MMPEGGQLRMAQDSEQVDKDELTDATRLEFAVRAIERDPKYVAVALERMSEVGCHGQLSEA